MYTLQYHQHTRLRSGIGDLKKRLPYHDQGLKRVMYKREPFQHLFMTTFGYIKVRNFFFEYKQIRLRKYQND